MRELETEVEANGWTYRVRFTEYQLKHLLVGHVYSLTTGTIITFEWVRSMKWPTCKLSRNKPASVDQTKFAAGVIEKAVEAIRNHQVWRPNLAAI